MEKTRVETKQEDAKSMAFFLYQQNSGHKALLIKRYTDLKQAHEDTLRLADSLAKDSNECQVQLYVRQKCHVLPLLWINVFKGGPNGSYIWRF